MREVTFVLARVLALSLGTAHTYICHCNATRRAPDGDPRRRASRARRAPADTGDGGPPYLCGGPVPVRGGLVARDQPQHATVARGLRRGGG